MKDNLHFKQLQLNYINNQKQKQKEYIRLVIGSIGVDVVVKIVDDIYVLIIIKIYSYFGFVFSIVPKKVDLLKISKILATLKILR